MRKKTKLAMVIVTLVILVAGAVLGMYFVTVNQYKKEMAEMTFRHSDASDIPDGTYTGECDVTLIYARVLVTVKDGKMTDIVLLQHDNGRGTPAEGIGKTILDRQTLEVDDITGATNASLVIKKAIDNALESALSAQ